MPLVTASLRRTLLVRSAANGGHAKQVANLVQALCCAKRVGGPADWRFELGFGIYVGVCAGTPVGLVVHSVRRMSLPSSLRLCGQFLSQCPGSSF